MHLLSFAQNNQNNNLILLDHAPLTRKRTRVALETLGPVNSGFSNDRKRLPVLSNVSLQRQLDIRYNSRCILRVVQPPT